MKGMLVIMNKLINKNVDNKGCVQLWTKKRMKLIFNKVIENRNLELKSTNNCINKPDYQ